MYCFSYILQVIWFYCIYSIYQGTLILCCTITDLRIFLCCSRDFLSCICEQGSDKGGNSQGRHFLWKEGICMIVLLKKIQYCWNNDLIQLLSHIRSQVTCESCYASDHQMWKATGGGTGSVIGKGSTFRLAPGWHFPMLGPCLWEPWQLSIRLFTFFDQFLIKRIFILGFGLCLSYLILLFGNQKSYFSDMHCIYLMVFVK